MESFFFYNGTYRLGDQLQLLKVEEISQIFDFQYVKSNFNTALKNCILNKFPDNQILEDPKEFLSIHKTCSVMEWGLIAINFIPKDAIIFEYIGTKVVSVSNSGEYAVVLDNNTTIDAANNANIARFSNHAPYFHPKRPWLKDIPIKLANIELHSIVCEGEKHALFITRQSIRAGNELLWNYGDEYWQYRPLHYINSKTGECFSETQNLYNFLKKKYSNKIQEYEKILQKNPNDLATNKNFTKSLLERAEIYSSTKNYSLAIEDLEKILETRPLSLNIKTRSLELWGKLSFHQVFLKLHEEYDAKCSQSLDDLEDEILDTAYDDETPTRKEILTFFDQYKNNECLNAVYPHLVSISQEFWLYSTIPAGFCIEADYDIVKTSYLSNYDWLYMMCDIDSYLCEQELSEECDYTQDIFQDCYPLL